MNSIDIKTITIAEALPIRHRVLWPNKSISFCSVEGDDTASHYGAFIDKRLVCVASIYINNNEARLRKFATLPQYQGQRIGSRVIEHILSDLKCSDVNYFWCDARKTALSFYQRFGLCSHGEPFQKSGISYLRMSISLR